MSETRHDQNAVDRATQAALAISLNGTIQGPCGLSMQDFSYLAEFGEWHTSGPRLDVAASEKAVGFAFNAQPKTYRIEGGVALIEISGVLFAKTNIFTRLGGGASAQLAAGQVSEAARDASVKSILVSIDSPGGSVFGAPELAQEIYSAGQQKPTVVHSDAMLQGTAYWAGAAANAVYISGPTVMVGGIGIVARHVHSQSSGTTEIVAGRFKRIDSSNSALTQAGAAYLQSRVDHIYSVFVDAVALYRGVTAAVANERMADGRTFVGQQAIDVGLVDAIAARDQLLKEMASNPAAFAKRRRLTARRAVTSGTTTTPVLRPVVAVQAEPIRTLSKAEQAEAAVAHSRKTGLDFVSAFKALGFAN